MGYKGLNHGKKREMGISWCDIFGWMKRASVILRSLVKEEYAGWWIYSKIKGE